VLEKVSGTIEAAQKSGRKVPIQSSGQIFRLAAITADLQQQRRLNAASA
jgi:hypothetical protein